MRYQRFAALVLAAALLLAGCGGTQSSPSAAADQSSGAASQSAAAAAVQTAQKERITDQYTLEKNVSGVWEADTGQYISVHVSVHVPQLECDSPDAASINDELNDIYAEHFREYEAYEEAGQPGSEYPQIGVNWDAYWYGDCVSLVIRRRDYDDAPWFYSGWCFDFATGQQITVAEMLQRMGLDPATVQQQMQRQAMQTFDREMAQGAYYEGLRSGGNLSEMRMRTLEYNELENLCLLLPEQNQLVIRGRYSSASEERWQQLDMEIPLQTAAQPQAQPVLTDTFDGVQVQLKGTQATITVSPAPKTATWNTELNLRLEQARTYPILGSYNEYVDVCIGQQTDSVFHPVVYLLTKDGVVEYVDVLRCLLFGDAMAMICQDPIYFANNGTALALRDAEVSLLCADGTETELAPLTAEWNSPQQVDSTGSFSLGEGENWCWLDLNSGGGCQLATHNNRYFYQGAVTYLGATPDGTALGFSLIRDTENGPEWVAFSAALKLDYSIDCLILTPLSGQNPLTNETVPLVLTHSYG